MAADLLELEIREGLVMHGAPGTRRILQGLKDLGVRIAIDEFGVGYSELNSLERYPLDSIKIDRSFIHHVSDASARLTDAVVALGKSLNVTIVGQGVETDEQAAFLRHHGCDELQGFHVHRPMPPSELAELLRRGGDSATHETVGERTGED
jgi:EAL domain-containing protein (putative c-di-GMP-specific phosphodiesterase class I)